MTYTWFNQQSLIQVLTVVTEETEANQPNMHSNWTHFFYASISPVPFFTPTP